MQNEKGKHCDKKKATGLQINSTNAKMMFEQCSTATARTYLYDNGAKAKSN